MKKAYAVVAATVASFYASLANATVTETVDTAFASGKTMVEGGAEGWIVMVAVLTGLGIVVSLLRK
ncbi:hypothetical protein [Methylomonas koyamae]|uniref:hypothetical protein n=1 Tax=Methylomonas koyamae TaxID=702114 RepID=UPI001C32A55E|nr:hypothetical protein [Methylomonas koyamae]BBL58644.1 hypothetical protein MKFW12EY_22570 [Methylomonas koyamae]